MKKLSFGRKFRLAINAIDRPIFTFAVFSAVVALGTAIGFNNSSAEGAASDIVLAVCVVTSLAWINAMGGILAPSMFMQRMKFFETMPVRMPEIRDTAFLNIIISHIIMDVPQCAVIAAILPETLLYMVCAQCVQLMLITVLIMPIYFSDKYMYTSAAALEDKLRKSVVVKGAVIGIGFMILSMLNYGFIMYRGLRAAAASDYTVLAAISAAALVIAAISAVFCRNIRTNE